jgi:hypothetical protein
MLIGVAVPVGAQIGPRLPRPGSGAEPSYWVGLSYGYMEGISLNDESSASTWQFAYSSQIMGTFEKTIQRGVTVGVSAGFSSANLTYSGTSLNNPCGLSCDATADITQYLAFVRGGGGLGFHGNYSLEAGMTQFSKFRARTTGNDLPPTGSKYDLTFGFGAGLGYGFSPTTDMYVAEQFDLVLHPQAPGGESRSVPRVMTFRAGFRVGF